MDAQEPLVPAPAEVVEFISRLLLGRWPRGDSERKAFFRQLGATGGERWDDAQDPSPAAHYALHTSLPDHLTSSWTSFQGHFLGVSLQPYTDPDPHSGRAHDGFAAIRELLTQLLGPPTHPWHDPEVQVCRWQHNGRRITLRFFHLQHSGVLLSVDDAGLALAAETSTGSAGGVPGGHRGGPRSGLVKTVGVPPIHRLTRPSGQPQGHPSGQPQGPPSGRA